MTIPFQDLDSGDEAFVLQRRHAETFGLNVSLRSNGDIEVLFDRAVAEKILEGLDAMLHDETGSAGMDDRREARRGDVSLRSCATLFRLIRGEVDPIWQ
ncbi:MAG: hypothetical protein RL885_19320 [Planctomycetota bacterium]